MNSFKSRKSKVLLTCIAVIMIACILCVTLAACKNEEVPPTPIDVFFVGDMQKNISDADLAKITAEGEHIYSVQEMLTATGYSVDDKSPENVKKLAAAIYALAATNYNNVTQSLYYIMTDADVLARKAVAGNDVNVKVRSTYSSITNSTSSFSQTVSGVTKLTGLGNTFGNLKDKFGYNTQSFSNSDFSASRLGSNGGAKFATKATLQDNLKWIMGAHNDSLTKKAGGSMTDNATAEESKPLPEYTPVSDVYPEGSTLAGKALPSFKKDREAWEPLNRLPARYWEGDNIIENYVEDGGTRYYMGTYGAGWAVYDMSRPNYLADGTTVEYNAALDLYTINMSIKDEFVAQACEFAAGDLIRDTKSYISLKNAEFTKISCKIEVYGNGLIKSMQKRDGLGTTEPSKVLGGLATCQKGGETSNTATAVFSYSDKDCDPMMYVALYWADLGGDEFYKKAKDQNGKRHPEHKLDLSGYATIDTYAPVINSELLNAFNDIFAEQK